MSSESERRVLILAPTKRDAILTSSLLGENKVECTICSDVDAVVRELKDGAAAILLAEEFISAGQSQPIVDAIDSQPPWSDLPVMLITGQGADSPAAARALQTLGNVTLVERPTRVTALLSTVHSALRARERQYQARDHLIERERTAEVLKQADRRKDEFLATLAHELRNPLAPIRNSLQILRMTACSDPTAERVCEMMERQVNHMVRLVDDLMEVSRITRGLIDLRKEETDLATVIRSAIETSRPLIEAGQHQLAITLPPEPIPLFGDAVRLGQVFANLLNNAAKYTNRGGQIWLSARQGGDEAVVCVRDNGIGISAEVLPAIFDMFMQANRATDRSQGGLGIGLTLVKSLVELHGGSISADSAGLGQGSEFIVRLPVAVAQQLGQQQATAGRSSERLPQRRVLVVDDNEDAAASMGMLLKYLGTDVEIAHDGPTALSTIDRYRPDVVLLDIGMPGMDGFEVARRIRERAEFDSIVLIALTGWGQAEDRSRTREAGFDHHLVKPADIRALQSVLVASGNEGRQE
jgi:signal transduction histidine kinase/ActR/RegA family two-component response regulator